MKKKQLVESLSFVYDKKYLKIDYMDGFEVFKRIEIQLVKILRR